MRERLPSVVFYANSLPHWRRVVADTLAGLLRVRPHHVPSWLWRFRHVRFLVAEEYRVLSYALDWKDAFLESPDLDVHLCNINNLVEYAAGLRRLRECPLGVILHSATGNNMALLRRAVRAFQARTGRLVVFFGNEFSGMDEKIAFARDTGADVIATQLPLPAAHWLYRDCRASTIAPAPAGLNPRIYVPGRGPRPIDLGFRGDRYRDLSLGDRDRATLIERVGARAARAGLTVDVRYQRLPREDWSGFLARCKGVVGAESGTGFLERDDRTQRAVAAFLARHPDADFETVHARFFQHYPSPVSGKAISSRHFEPIGTKTCQVLLEGHYNGILKAGEHYIAVKRDYSNLDEALDQFADPGCRAEISERAYAYVMESHTYAHRVRELLRAVETLDRGGAGECRAKAAG